MASNGEGDSRAGLPGYQDDATAKARRTLFKKKPRKVSLQSEIVADANNLGGAQHFQPRVVSRHVTSFLWFGYKKTFPLQQTPAHAHGGASDSEVLDAPCGGGEGGSGKLSVSPRVSMSATEDENPPSGSSTPKRKFSKFNIGESRTLPGSRGVSCNAGERTYA